MFAQIELLAEIDQPAQLVALLAKLGQSKVVDETRRQMLSEKCRRRREESIEDLPLEAMGAARQPSAELCAIEAETWENLLRDRGELQRRVLQLRCEGNSWKEIADQFGMSERNLRRCFTW